MVSAGPAAGRAASTATAPAGSGWRSGIPAMRPSEIPGLGSGPSRALRLIGAVGGARETCAPPPDQEADQGARPDSPCANLASSDRARRPA